MTFEGVGQVRFKKKVMNFIDGYYSTSDIGEIEKLKELGFKEKTGKAEPSKPKKRKKK